MTGEPAFVLPEVVVPLPPRPTLIAAAAHVHLWLTTGPARDSGHGRACPRNESSVEPPHSGSISEPFPGPGPAESGAATPERRGLPSAASRWPFLGAGRYKRTQSPESAAAPSRGSQVPAAPPAAAPAPRARPRRERVSAPGLPARPRAAQPPRGGLPTPPPSPPRARSVPARSGCGAPSPGPPWRGRAGPGAAPRPRLPALRDGGSAPGLSHRGAPSPRRAPHARASRRRALIGRDAREGAGPARVFKGAGAAPTDTEGPNGAGGAGGAVRDGGAASGNGAVRDSGALSTRSQPRTALRYSHGNTPRPPERWWSRRRRDVGGGLWSRGAASTGAALPAGPLLFSCSWCSKQYRKSLRRPRLALPLNI